MASHALELEGYIESTASASGAPVLHHGYRDKTPASPRDMPFDGDDGDARDGASPSGSSGFIRTRSQQPEHRFHPSTPPGGNLDSGETTIHGRYTLAQKLRAIEKPTNRVMYIHTYMRTCVQAYTSHPDGRDSTVLIEGTVGGSGGRRADGKQKGDAREKDAVQSPRSTRW